MPCFRSHDEMLTSSKHCPDCPSPFPLVGKMNDVAGHRYGIQFSDGLDLREISKPSNVVELASHVDLRFQTRVPHLKAWGKAQQLFLDRLPALDLIAFLIGINDTVKPQRRIGNQLRGDLLCGRVVGCSSRKKPFSRSSVRQSFVESNIVRAPSFSDRLKICIASTPTVEPTGKKYHGNRCG